MMLDDPIFEPELFSYNELAELVVKLLAESNQLHVDNNALRVKCGQQTDELVALDEALARTEAENDELREAIDQFRVLDVMREAAAAINAGLARYVDQADPNNELGA